ncbi:MAG: radical SAM family heme chaperone HemW [Candidatus Omnitrophota bacterium]
MMPALYIHIPFCQKKCPYCSFAVVVGQCSKMADYIQALLSEAQVYRGCCVSTVYVGGGTPSLLDVENITILSEGLSANFSVKGCEATFEFNPESVSRLKAGHVRACGFNRASLGLQSFHGSYLSYLGRSHTDQEGFSAFQVLREAGFDNISIDLMFGFPEQTEAQLDVDIDAAIALKSEHISIYALTVEARSLFEVRGEMMEDERQALLYRRVLARLKNAGFEQYEVSNFARPGFASRHNMNYWQGGDYIALGMGAHGHLDGERYWNAETFPRYLQLMQESRSAVVGRERLAAPEKMMECLLFGLRMNRGVDLQVLEQRFHVGFGQATLDEIECLTAEGLLIKDGSCVLATDAGRLLLDAISVKLV